VVVQVNPLDEALTLIDGTLNTTAVKGRNLMPTDEVQNIMLDIRLLIEEAQKEAPCLTP